MSRRPGPERETSRRPGPERETNRTPAPEERPVALSIAGSDSGGGAGIQADLQTMAAHGAFPTSVITSVTAQHTRGVERAFTLPIEEITAQYDAVTGDFDVRAIKTGMLAEAPVVEAVTERVADLDASLVVDPVMVATSGDRLLSRAGERAYEELVREATLVTPNRDETTVLTDVEPNDAEAARNAGEALIEMGADAALVKGGHDTSEGGHDDGDTLVDVLVTRTETGSSTRCREFTHPRVSTEATHGSGCALSSAIAARLATGADLESAVERSIRFMQRAIRYPLAVGQGPGAVNPMVELRERAQRGRVAETVATLVEELLDRGEDARALVPEVGMNVVGATRYAESVDETLAVEGRIRRTTDGVAVARGVRAGASSHVARFLLSAREFVPEFRFAANVRNDASTRAGLANLDDPTEAIDRSKEPADTATMNWIARAVYGDRSHEGDDDGGETTPPVAVYDDGDVGKEPMIRLLAADAGTLADRLWTILEGGRDDRST